MSLLGLVLDHLARRESLDHAQLEVLLESPVGLAAGFGLLDLLNILPDILRALLDQLRRIFPDHNAGVIHHTLENMEEVHEIFVLGDGLILALE